MFIVGITGGTGAGKTTALDVLREMGGLIIDCDAVYHDLAVKLLLKLSQILYLDNLFIGPLYNHFNI